MRINTNSYLLVLLVRIRIFVLLLSYIIFTKNKSPCADKKLSCARGLSDYPFLLLFEGFLTFSMLKNWTL